MAAVRGEAGVPAFAAFRRPGNRGLSTGRMKTVSLAGGRIFS